MFFPRHPSCWVLINSKVKTYTTSFNLVYIANEKK